ncbi:Putative nuclease HARBI1, partial [Linum perenne]
HLSSTPPSSTSPSTPLPFDHQPLITPAAKRTARAEQFAPTGSLDQRHEEASTTYFRYQVCTCRHLPQITVMARRTTIRRRRVIIYVVALWWNLLQQAIWLLMDSMTNQTTSADDDTEVPRPLPYDREVYRRGFMFNTTRASDVNCISMLRMRRRIFWKLCQVLEEFGGLTRTRNVDVDEMVAMFLLTVGHNAKNRTCQIVFHRSGETVSRIIHSVFCAILKLHEMMLAKPSPVPDNCTDHRWKYFKGCLGALDGTIINVRTRTASQARYRTRKGTTGINCLGVVNQRMQFIYCLAGWEGSAHDSRVLRDALARAGGLRVPQGNYYLCDVGYMNANGFLAPYRGQRYHLQEWGANRPTRPEEMFNMRHSKARNVIECTFGILKMRWAMLRDTSWYSPRMVGLFFTACCLLHNFIRTHGGPDVFEQAYAPPAEVDAEYVETINDAPGYVEASESWNQFRHALAQQMWTTRGQ